MAGPGSDAYRNLGWGNGPFLVLWGHVGAQNWISGVPNWISGVPKYMFWNSRSRFSNAFLLKEEFSVPNTMKADSDHGAFRPCCVQTLFCKLSPPIMMNQFFRAAACGSTKINVA